jgi:CRISPR/Cas system CSM-associated protein Csm3 (group 7 of RAMP superfamily)
MSQLYLTRILIETTAPLAINSGGRETGFDSQLARDANQLPYIPASSLAGVWRHLVHSCLGADASKRWFGCVDDNGESSRLFVQDGLLLDSQGHIVQGLVEAERIAADPLLQRLQQTRPHHRERVRINDRGVASDMGKFDQIILPTGIRFCIDIRWKSDDVSESDRQEWQQLLSYFAHPAFALGSSTRNGLGRFKIIADEQNILTLTNNPSAGATLRKFVKRETLPTKVSSIANDHRPFARLELTALDSWRCGQGSRPLGDKTDQHTDSFTYSEPTVRWHKGKAHWNDQPQAILCGSGIKGILAHRLAYHYRRRNGAYAEIMAEASHQEWESRPQELGQLLGTSREKNGAGTSEQEVAGQLFVDDAVIVCDKTLIRTHNSIDRFTGGVRQGALFSEELLWQPKIALTLRLASNATISQSLADALADTLEDLKLGLLPLGAGSGRGNSLVEHQTGQIWDIDWAQLTILAQE